MQRYLLEEFDEIVCLCFVGILYERYFSIFFAVIFLCSCFLIIFSGICSSLVRRERSDLNLTRVSLCANKFVVTIGMNCFRHSDISGETRIWYREPLIVNLLLSSFSWCVDSVCVSLMDFRLGNRDDYHLDLCEFWKLIRLEKIYFWLFFQSGVDEYFKISRYFPHTSWEFWSIILFMRRAEADGRMETIWH